MYDSLYVTLYSWYRNRLLVLFYLCRISQYIFELEWLFEQRDRFVSTIEYTSSSYLYIKLSSQMSKNRSTRCRHPVKFLRAFHLKLTVVTVKVKQISYANKNFHSRRNLVFEFIFKHRWSNIEQRSTWFNHFAFNQHRALIYPVHPRLSSSSSSSSVESLVRKQEKIVYLRSKLIPVQGGR